MVKPIGTPVEEPCGPCRERGLDQSWWARGMHRPGTWGLVAIGFIVSSAAWTLLLNEENKALTRVLEAKARLDTENARLRAENTRLRSLPGVEVIGGMPGEIRLRWIDRNESAEIERRLIYLNGRWVEAPGEIRLPLSSPELEGR